nr:hypothetical protein [Tanacetum cinerariifolium]
MNLSNVVTNDLFQPWRALLTITNLCLTGKTSGFERPRAPVLQILWGIVTRTNIDYVERIWEEFTQSIHTFIEDKRNLSRHTSGKKRATLIVIPSIRFTKLIIHHLQRKHRFHARLDSSLHLSNEEPVLGYLKFSAKGTKNEVFEMPIPDCLITVEIQHATYYQEYLAKVADEDADYQKAMEESMKDAYALPKGPLPLVVIREPESGKYQPLPEVPGKGKAKVTEEQSYNEEESKKTGSDAGAQADGQAGSNPDETSEGQAGSNPDETSKGQAGPDPGDAEAKVQSIPSHVVYARSDREYMDLDVADVLPQPSTDQLDEGFTATAYPKVQENLKLTVEEQVLLEEPASSSGTLSSLQHLSRDFSFGDQFFSDKHSNADKNAETKVESMVIIDVSEVVTDAVDWAMQAPLRNRLRDLLEADMKEILHQRMWESDSYKSHEDHMQLFEALEKSMNRDHSEKLTQDLAEARKKKKKSYESPKTPPGSPSYQPPPPPPPAGPFKALGAPRASGSAQMPPSPPPPSSTNQESPSKGSAAPSPSKTAASAEYQAWTTTDIRLMSFISLTPADLEMDEDMAPDEQVQSSDDEDIESAHIPTVNLRQGWWKPFEEERPTTLKPAREVVTDAVDWAMQAPLRNRLRDLLEADMKEILHQRMWESDSYKSHEDHMQLFEALEKSMNRDHSEKLTQDLAEARKKKKKSYESPKTPPGSPSYQPPPPPPPAGPFKALGAPRASGSAQMPPSPPPPSSTNQESPSKGSAAPSPSKTAASAEYQAWTTTDIRLMSFISLTPADLEMDEDMAPGEQAQSSDDEDIGSAHIPTVNLRQGWWKPFEEERPTTSEPAWSIRSSDVEKGCIEWGGLGGKEKSVFIGKSYVYLSTDNLPSPVVYARPNFRHMDLEVTDVSSQPHPEQIDKGFTATAYLKVQENLKLTVEEQVILEEPASSTGTLSSLQHFTNDLSFGDLLFNDKPSEANNEKTIAETEVESMMSVTIQQDTSSIPPLTTSIIDLTSRPESSNLHQPLQATSTETTTT